MNLAELDDIASHTEDGFDGIADPKLWRQRDALVAEVRRLRGLVVEGHVPIDGETCSCSHDYNLGSCSRCDGDGFVLDYAAKSVPCPDCVGPAHIAHLQEILS